MQPELALGRETSTPNSSDGVIAAEHEDWCFGRTIVMLAPGDRIDAEALGRSVGPGGRQLLFLSVGYPPTPDQRAGTDAGMQRAIDRGIPFEARLAWTIDEALDLVSPLDEVLQCLAERLPCCDGGLPGQREQR